MIGDNDHFVGEVSIQNVDKSGEWVEEVEEFETSNIDDHGRYEQLKCFNTSYQTDTSNSGKRFNYDELKEDD